MTEQEKKERRKERDKAYYEKNKEKWITYNKISRIKNREKIRARDRATVRVRTDKRRGRKRKRNIEKSRAYSRNYYERVKGTTRYKANRKLYGKVRQAKYKDKRRMASRRRKCHDPIIVNSLEFLYLMNKKLENIKPKE